MCGSRAFSEQAAIGTLYANSASGSHGASKEAVIVSPGKMTGWIYKAWGQDMATMTCHNTLKTWSWTISSEAGRE